MPEDHRRDDHRGAEVGLQHDQRERHRGEGQRQHDVDVARLVLGVALLGEQHRHADHERHLGELRGLHREAGRQHDPRVRPVDGGAQRRQDRQQADQRQHVEHRRVGPQHPVVEQRRGDREAHADGQR